MYLLLKEELEEIKNNKEILSDEELSNIQVTQPSEEQLNIVKHEAIIGDNKLRRVNNALRIVIDILIHTIGVLVVVLAYEVLSYLNIIIPGTEDLTVFVTIVLLIMTALSILLDILYYTRFNREALFKKAFNKGEFKVINADMIGSILTVDKIGMLCNTAIQIDNKYMFIDTKVIDLCNRAFIARISINNKVGKYLYKVIMY